MSEFKQGDEVYDEHGASAIYVGRTAYGHAVQRIYEPEHGDEPHVGSVVEWSHAFSKPPVPKLVAEVQALNDQVDQKKAELALLQANVRSLEEEMRNRRERIKQHEKLQLLDEFIQGKITHFVVTPSYGARHISTAEEMLKSSEDDGWYRAKKMRLLSLYGGSQGDLTWAIAAYSDGSGNSADVVTPCTSYEQAREELEKLTNESFARHRKDGFKEPWRLDALISAAQSIGMEVPADAAAAFTECMRAAALRSLPEHEKRVADAVAALEKARAIARTAEAVAQ